MKQCPECGATERQSKAGFTKAGSQRYKCMHCSKKYTPEPKQAGYAEEIRQLAIRMYVDGGNFRRIARHLRVHHQSVINWVNAHVEKLPESPVPETVENVEMDELYTFIVQKKTGFTS